MLKQALKSIIVMLKYARIPTALKLTQLSLSAVLTPLSMFFTQQLVDSIKPYVDGKIGINNILVWIVFLFISLLFMASNGFFNGILQISLTRSVNQNLSPAIVQKFQRIEYYNFEEKNVHDTINRISNNPQEKILNIFLSVVTVIALLVTMIGTALVYSQVSIWFSVGFVALLLPMVWSDFHAMSMMNEVYNSQSTMERKLRYYIQLLSEKISLSELKAFSAVPYIQSKIFNATDKVQKERFHVTVSSQKFMIFSSLIFKIWTAFTIVFMIIAINNHSITLGVFVSLFSATGTIISNTDQLSFNFSNLSRQYLEIIYYNQFMSLPEIVNTERKHILTHAPVIRFEDVSFSYPNTNKLILDHVSFTVNPREKVAIVGKNGAGKSTIIKLLCSLYKPTSGRITVGGIDINCLTREQLRKVYSIVFQDYVNYTLTLRENVSFGNILELHNDNLLKDAIHQGMADDILTLNNKGLDIHLGKLENDGIDLSGGQWQRVAIARACVADSNFIILDEPTAALDPIAESEMYTSFLKLLNTSGKGSILISHRLASARMSDRIIVIDNGTVVETGSHEELMTYGGLYQEMFEKQRTWYINGEKDEADDE